MKSAITLTAIFFSLIISFSAFSQCKMFAKKYCMEKIKPYIYNGQINTLKISEGDMAELNLSFQKDQSYRIYVCSQGNFERVEFKVVDATNNDMLFYNKNQEFTDIWDFKAQNAQQIIVRVFIPESSTKGNMPQTGCVSIMVGFTDK